MSKMRAEYTVWAGMKSRCSSKAPKVFRLYGGRGISVCERWRKSFDDFLADMGPRPSSKHSIDRINNDGNYEPGNCRWATHSQQMRNTNQNHMVTIRGKKVPLVEAAELAGINQNAALNRIVFLGNWMRLPAEAALCWPVARNASERGRLAWVKRLWLTNYRRAFGFHHED